MQHSLTFNEALVIYSFIALLWIIKCFHIRSFSFKALTIIPKPRLDDLDSTWKVLGVMLWLLLWPLSLPDYLWIQIKKRWSKRATIALIRAWLPARFRGKFLMWTLKSGVVKVYHVESMSISRGDKKTYESSSDPTRIKF